MFLPVSNKTKHCQLRKGGKIEQETKKPFLRSQNCNSESTESGSKQKSGESEPFFMRKKEEVII